MSTLTRRNLREHLIKLLYIRDFHEPEELEEQIQLYFELYNREISTEDPTLILSEGDCTSVIDRYNQILDKLGEIDYVIAEAMSGWSLNRVSKLELNILRIAVYEIKFDEAVPAKVSINEAVELAKLYGSKDSSYGFVNGILAKLIK